MSSTLWLIVLCGALSIVYEIITTRGLMAADLNSGEGTIPKKSVAAPQGSATNRSSSMRGCVGLGRAAGHRRPSGACQRRAGPRRSAIQIAAMTCR